MERADRITSAEELYAAAQLRWSNERADFENQINKLVNRTILELLEAAEELKGRVRCETDQLLGDYRQARSERPSEIEDLSQRGAAERECLRTTSASSPSELRLRFENVAGYDQAAALEDAIQPLIGDGNLDVVEFEGRRLVLLVRSSAAARVVRSLLTAAPLSLRLIQQQRGEAAFLVA